MAVCFIRYGKAGPIYIGATKDDPHRRLAALQRGTPCELRLLVSVPGDVAEIAALHERFAELHIRGEWFRAEQELLHFVEGMWWVSRRQQPRQPPRRCAAPRRGIDARSGGGGWSEPPHPLPAVTMVPPRGIH